MTWERWRRLDTNGWPATGAPLPRLRADVDDRLVRQAEVVAEQVDGHDRHGAAVGPAEQAVAGRELLAEVAPEAPDHRRRLRLLHLDQHLAQAPVHGSHPSGEVHADDRQRQAIVAGAIARDRPLLRPEFERLHVEARDLSHQQPGDPVALHQVLEDDVVDGVGDFHAQHSTSPRRWRQRSPSVGREDRRQRLVARPDPISYRAGWLACRRMRVFRFGQGWWQQHGRASKSAA